MSSDDTTDTPGWRGLADDMLADLTLAEYIDEFRDELELIAGESHVISPLVQALLDGHDREERRC